jgi:hypothetical protein
LGIIETLSAGFDLVRRKVWLILVPVLLDIALWLAPKLSIVTLVKGLLNNPVLSTASPEMARSLADSTQMLQQVAESMDLGALASSGMLGVPGLIISESPRFFGLTKRVIEVPGGLTLIGLGAGLWLVGLLLGAFYLGLIAQQVRDEQADLGALLRNLPRYWLRLVGAFALILGLLFCLALPVGILLAIFGLLSQGMASMLMGLFSFGVLWILIYLAFVPQAVLMGEDGVLKSIWHSMNVVRISFWSALGLLVLVNIITAGFMFVWDRVAVNSAGALFAIVANAFVGTGLSAGVFIFYRERFRAWRAAVEDTSLAAR